MKTNRNPAATTPLRHFPYPEHVDSPDPYRKPTLLVDEVKMEELSPERYHLGHGHGNVNYPPPQQYGGYDSSSNFSTPSPSSAPQYHHQNNLNYQNQNQHRLMAYTDPMIPFSGRPTGRRAAPCLYSADIPLNSSGPFHYGNQQDQKDFGRLDMKMERYNGKENEDEGEEEEEKNIPKTQKRVSNRKKKTEGRQEANEMKPPRKYSQKSEGEKKTPEYRTTRNRNNEAVRKSRAKQAVLQKKKDMEFEKMRAENEELKEQLADMGGLIERVRQEVSKCRDSSLFNEYPSLSELILYKN